MTINYHFALKPEQDCLGYFYGRFDVGTASYRIDVMPPATEPLPPWFIRSAVVIDADRWIISVDGEEVGRVATREDVELFLAQHLLP